MTNLPESRDDLLQALLCGDVDPRSEAAAARLAADPELRERFEQLRGLEGVLLEAKGVRDDVLAELSNEPAAHTPAEEADLLARLQPPPQLRSAPLPIRRYVLAAAALLLISVGVVWATDPFAEDGPSEAPGYSWLGEGGIEIPRGLPFGTLRIELPSDDPLDAEIHVRAFGLDAAGARGDLLVEILDADQLTFELPEDPSAERRCIEWEVEVYVDGNPVPRVHVFQQVR